MTRYSYPEGELPHVNFLIPSFEGKHSISRCIKSILAQEYPQHLIRIIIIENGSSDGTAEIIEEFQNVTYRFLKRASRSAARNCYRDYPGTFTAFVDVDVELEPTWLKNSMSRMDDPFIAAVNGPILRTGNHWLDEIRRTVSELSTNQTSSTLNGSTFQFSLNTAAVLVRNDTLNSIGGFDERLKRAEDFDLTHRLLKAGYTLAQSNEAIAKVYWDRGFFEYVVYRSFDSGFYTARVLAGLGLKRKPKLRELLFSMRKSDLAYSKRLIIKLMEVFYLIGFIFGKEARMIHEPKKPRPVLISHKGQMMVRALPVFGIICSQSSGRIVCYETLREITLSGDAYKVYLHLLRNRRIDLDDEGLKALNQLQSFGLVM